MEFKIMKYYQDITLLPDAEANLGFLWQKVYQQVHLALVENKTADNTSNIAVSFPKYHDKEFPLGNKLRLFASSQEILQQLDINKWLSRLTDYTHCTSIKETPISKVKFVCFKRKQFKSNLEKVAQRQAKYKGIEFSQALKYVKEHYDKEIKLPYIRVESLSTNTKIEPMNRKKFKLFIEKNVVSSEIAGDFNCYGLSRRNTQEQATTPWF